MQMAHAHNLTAAGDGAYGGGRRSGGDGGGGGGGVRRRLRTALKASMSAGAAPSMRLQSLLACAAVMGVRSVAGLP
jgi:hypothetical protein